MPSAAAKGEREVVGFAFDSGNLHPQRLEAARALVVADVVGTGSLVVLKTILEHTTVIVGRRPVVHVAIIGKAFNKFRRLERARTDLHEGTIGVLIEVLVGGVEYQLTLVDSDTLAAVGNLVAIGAQEHLAVLSHTNIIGELVAQGGLALLGHHGHEVTHQVAVLVDLKAVELHIATRVVATMAVGTIGIQVEDVHLVDTVVGHSAILASCDDGSRLRLTLTCEAHRASLGIDSDAGVHWNLVGARLLIALVAFESTAVAALVASAILVGTTEHDEGVALPVAVAGTEDSFPILGRVLGNLHVGDHACSRLVDIACVNEAGRCVQASLYVLNVLLHHWRGNLQVSHVHINAIAFVLVEVVQHVHLAVGLVEHVRIGARVSR